MYTYLPYSPSTIKLMFWWPKNKRNPLCYRGGTCDTHLEGVSEKHNTCYFQYCITGSDNSEVWYLMLPTDSTDTFIEHVQFTDSSRKARLKRNLFRYMLNEQSDRPLACPLSDKALPSDKANNP
jgi:hypothetical protein